jgi:hypothetical protein
VKTEISGKNGQEALFLFKEGIYEWENTWSHPFDNIPYLMVTGFAANQNRFKLKKM